MRHIDGNGGRFVTVLPRTRAEDKWFRDWAQTNQPQWTEAIRLPGARVGEPDKVYSTCPAPLPSAEGYRIIWVHSNARPPTTPPPGRPASRPAPPRSTRSPPSYPAPSRLTTRVAVEEAAAAALTDTDAARSIAVTVAETIEETFRQERRGRPGANTRYRKSTRTRYAIDWHPRADMIVYDAATDGCFPLATNDTSPARS